MAAAGSKRVRMRPSDKDRAQPTCFPTTLRPTFDRGLFTRHLTIRNNEQDVILAVVPLDNINGRADQRGEIGGTAELQRWRDFVVPLQYLPIKQNTDAFDSQRIQPWKPVCVNTTIMHVSKASGGAREGDILVLR